MQKESQANNSKPIQKQRQRRTDLATQAIGLIAKICTILAVCCALILFVAFPYRESDNNMFPSVKDGDLCIIYKLDKCQVGDIVAYDNGETIELGRIVAKEGSTVDFQQDGGYTVNGLAPSEEVPYETYAAENSRVRYPLLLKSNEVFIMNDFRQDTGDSREIGAVPASNVKGKVVMQLRRRNF